MSLKKFLIVFVVFFIAQTLISTSKVNASTNPVDMPILIKEKSIIEENEIDLTTEKIMKIDSKTGRKTVASIDYAEITPILEKMEKEENYSTELVAKTTTENNNNKLSNINTFFLTPLRSTTGYTICVANTDSETQRPICKVTSDGGEGTGFLIGEKYLLTAAHCVLTPDANVFGYWSAWAGYCNGNYAQKMGWNTVYYSENWTTYGAGSSFDWAIVELDGNYGSSLGWLYCTKYYDFSDMINKEVSAWGYPATTMNGQYLCYSTGIITNANSWTFDSSCKVERGFSGGPTRMSDNTACGINIAMYSNDDRTGTLKSVRFNNSLFDLILDLLNN